MINAKLQAIFLFNKRFFFSLRDCQPWITTWPWLLFLLLCTIIMTERLKQWSQCKQRRSAVPEAVFALPWVEIGCVYIHTLTYYLLGTPLNQILQNYKLSPLLSPDFLKKNRLLFFWHDCGQVGMLIYAVALHWSQVLFNRSGLWSFRVNEYEYEMNLSVLLAC